jgi:hypothetical protein
MRTMSEAEADTHLHESWQGAGNESKSPEQISQLKDVPCGQP